MAKQHTQQPFFKPTSSPATGSFFLNYSNASVNGRTQSHKILTPQQQNFNGISSVTNSPNSSCFRQISPTGQREKGNQNSVKFLLTASVVI